MGILRPIILDTQQNRNSLLAIRIPKLFADEVNIEGVAVKKNFKLNQGRLINCQLIDKVKGRLKLTCPEEGGGVSFCCKDISWDDYKYLVFQVKNREEWMFRYRCQVLDFKGGKS